MKKIINLGLCLTLSFVMIMAISANIGVTITCNTYRNAWSVVPFLLTLQNIQKRND